MKTAINKVIQNGDRRTEKTKKFLAEALKELIVEKGYDAITVQDIIDRANVGRSTFYSHYENKDQLLIGNVNFQSALVNVSFDDKKEYPMGVNLNYLFNHTREHLDLSKAMFGTKSIEILNNYFIDICAGKIYECPKGKLSGPKENVSMIRYKAEAAAGGIIRMLFMWLKDEAVVPVEEMISQAKIILETCNRSPA